MSEQLIYRPQPREDRLGTSTRNLHFPHMSRLDSTARPRDQPRALRLTRQKHAAGFVPPDL